MNTIDYGVFLLRINNDIATMDFNPEGDRYPQYLIDDVFNRETKFLNQLKDYSWIPEVLSINFDDKKINFKWYNNTCDDLIVGSFKEQLLKITKDLHKEKLIKPNFYPNCFYTDDNDILHTFAFYSTSTYDEQPININFYSSILNEERESLIKSLTPNEFLDMRILQKQAYKNYIKWPENPLPKIYEEVHE